MLQALRSQKNSLGTLEPASYFDCREQLRENDENW